MSFLTPLYLLGALAVSLPILFHMIRRVPRDRREFSSVMFLQPSPPKITRRSRIEHWLLLLLRALAVCLLALAFARPFFRQSAQQAVGASEGKSIVVLLDTSASMRRQGVWEEATDQLRRELDDADPADRLAVLTFDDRRRTVTGFEQWAAIDPAQRTSAVFDVLAETAPGWRATDLAAALIEAAEQLDHLTTDTNSVGGKSVIVISDLQAGSRLEALQAYDWPKGITVKLAPVGVDSSPNNAGVAPVANATSNTTEPQPRARVRITNSNGADRDEFTIRWTDEFDTPTEPAAARDSPPAAESQSVSVIVPAGQSRIVRAAARPDGPGTGRLTLTGDEHAFDNVCYVPPPRTRSAAVALLSGEVDDSDPQQMPFYLPAALPSVPQREIEIASWDDADATQEASPNPDLVIVTTSPAEAEVPPLRQYVQQGGTVLFAATSADEYAGLFALLDVDTVSVSEAEIDDYVMLSTIDYSHPLFASLADARFSDFTKVRFWRHRTLPMDALPHANVVARFDDGDAAVIQLQHGKGRVIVFAAGWQPADSQLAVSTKFVPMLNGLIDDVAGIVQRRTTYLVGDSVPFAEFDLAATDLRSVKTPTGEQVSVADGATAFAETDSPGVYQLLLRDDATNSDASLTFAVNIDPAESRMSRLPTETLAAAGMLLESESAAPVLDESARRQLRAAELENRQKLWRWLVFAVIAILLLETLLASRAARRTLVST